MRLIEASNFLAWRLEEAHWVSQTHGSIELAEVSGAGYCCIQQRCSCVRPRPGVSFDPQITANDDLLDYCRARGITMLAYSPLLSGAYASADRRLCPCRPGFSERYPGSDTDARLAALKAVAEEVEATPNRSCWLGWYRATHR